jgi:hypothetical protein
MGSNKTVLPENKFSGEEDIRGFLRDFEIFVAVNEWSDVKAGQYLAVFLKDDAKAFYHQQSDTVRKSYKELSRAFKERYEGGLALLKYKKEFNARNGKDGETLHSYLSDLRLSYERAYSPPTVDPLPADANADQKIEHAQQEGALVFYNRRKDGILCQFVNGLGKELREVLIREDGLLKKSVENVLKQISTLEEEQGVTRKVSAAQRAGKLDSHVDGAQNVEEVAHQQPSLENKLDEILKNQRTFQAAAVKKGGKRFPGKQRPVPKPSDICRACNGRGHWARNCPSLNEGGAGRRPPVQP